MGQFWLHDIDDILRQGVGRGIVGIEEVSGWPMRSRASGGLDSINGLLKHHTASPESWDWDRDIEYIAFTNPFKPSPVSQLYHGRSGKIAIVAAGAANHGGKGGAYKPGGPLYVQVDRANQTLIGDEMGNNGIGEQWPWEQIMASITSDALICLAEQWGPGHVFAHKEYCGPGTTEAGRKIDPWGPWENHPQRFWPDGSSWGDRQGNIDFYRALVAVKMAELSQEINLMFGFVPRPAAQPPRVFDTRGPTNNFDGYKLGAGTNMAIQLPGAAGKGFAVVNLTSVHSEGPGFFTVWNAGDVPTSSALNWAAGQTIANEITVPLAPDGSFRIYTPVRTHVVVDLVGFYQSM